MRLSDAERDQMVDALHQAVGDGRLTLAEFEERVGGVLAARTRAEVTPYLVDLPTATAVGQAEVRSRASSVRRVGRWVVPRRLAVNTRSSNVRLDFTQATIRSPVVEVALDVRSSSVKLILPAGASAEIDEVEMSASSAKSTVPNSGGIHLVVRGRLQSSSLRVRYQRRFLHWRW
jgi:hypothetical protein